MPHRRVCLLIIAFAALICAGNTAIRASESDSGSANARFLRWFQEHGGRVAKITLDEFAGVGRGIKAVSEIKTGDEVLRVPSSIIFSVPTLTRSQDPLHRRIVAAFSGTENDEHVVVAALLLELCRGTKSRFHEYISILPRYVPNLSHFSPDNLAALQHPKLEEDVLRAQDALVLKFEQFLRIVEAFWPQDGLAIHLTQLTLGDYRWATSIMDSRGLRFKSRVYLAPLADMFNYAPHPLKRPSNAGEFFLTHHRLEDDHLTIFADRRASPNEQLFEDYGDNPDAIYLQYHGFVPEENPFRCISLQAPQMNDLPSHNREMLEAIRFQRAPQQCVESTGELDEAMIVYHTCIAMTSEEVDKCIALKRSGNLPWEKLAVSCGFRQVEQDIDKQQRLGDVSDLTNRTRAAIYLTLSAHVKPTGVEEDEARLSSLEKKWLLVTNQNDDSRELQHHQMAVRYRLHSKRVVVAILEKYQNANDVERDKAGLLQIKIEAFNDWFARAVPSVNSLAAAYLPGFRIGTIATRHIVKGDPYLGVPVSVILDSEVAWRHKAVGALVQGLSIKYKGARDDFHELLFLLLHEAFVLREQSPYWPYFALLPTHKDLDIPLLWSSDDSVLERLGPSLITTSILEYRNKTRNAFKGVSSLPPVREFYDSLPGDVNPWTWRNYQWATAILDSRSIWWGGKRHLVPMLDFVNCVEGPSGHKVHSTSLDAAGKHAMTSAAWGFSRGEQVFENYGQPNHIYFSYHGFSLPAGENSYDCVQHEFRLDRSGMSDDAEFRQEAEDIARRIFTRGGGKGSDFVMDVCLKQEMLESVWFFLALQMNSVASLKRQGLLGKPTPEASSVLVSIVETRLESYSRHRTTHEPSRRFLTTEQKMLEGIADKYRQLGLQTQFDEKEGGKIVREEL